MTPAIEDLIVNRASATEIRAQAVAEGMKLLVDDGWDKITQGVTTVEEVERVTFDTRTTTVVTA
jgi:type IV pilus assembly protein PilB